MIDNPTSSPYFYDGKILRKEIAFARGLGKHKKIKNYAFDYVVLLSRAVCDNVDKVGDVELKNSDKPQAYIRVCDLPEVLGVTTEKEALEILDVLKNKYNAIDYDVKMRRHGRFMYRTAYFHFYVGVKYITRGTYSRRNKNAVNCMSAILNDEGFVYIDKTAFFKTFYGGKEQAGILDYFMLLRLNAVYNADYMEEYIPNDLRNCHMALWRVDAKSKEKSEFSIYCRISDIADFLNISPLTINMYNKQLEKAGLLHNIYLNKRGTVFLFPLLDKLNSDEYNNPDNSFEDHNRILAEKSTLNTEKIAAVIKSIILGFYEKTKKYLKNGFSVFKEKFRFLNYTAKSRFNTETGDAISVPYDEFIRMYNKDDTPLPWNEGPIVV